MKRLLVDICLVCASIGGTLTAAAAPSNEVLYAMAVDQSNYIAKLTVTKPLAMGSALAKVEGSAILDVTFYDGLGRAVSQVAARRGNKGEDVATFTEYDEFGRVSRSWVPVPLNSANGTFCPTAEDIRQSVTNTFGPSGTPYSLTRYENLPDGRPVSQSAPGAVNVAKAVSTSYGYCTGKEGVLKLSWSGSAISKPSSGYSAGALKTVTVTDEDGRQSCDFFDWKGRKICSRVIATPDTLNTYYVYDYYGDLCCVVQPEGVQYITARSTSINSDALRKYAFCYDYDQLHRCIYARVPGSEPVYYVYDTFGQPVMWQDGIQRLKDEWTVCEYDSHLRPVAQGVHRFSGKTHAQLREMMDAQTFTAVRQPNANDEYGLFYTHDSKLSGFQPYIAWMYDDYNFVYGSHPSSSADYPVNTSLEATGLLTGVAQVMDNTPYITSYYYDEMGRNVCTIENDYYGNMYRLTQLNRYNFDGSIDRSLSRYEAIVEHEYVTDSRLVEFQYSYDGAGRLTETKYRVNSADNFKSMQTCAYNSMGQLASTTDALTTAYTYDMAGRFKSSSSPVFSQELFYNTSPNGGSAYHNGFISYITEKEGNTASAASDCTSFSYDGAGRLTSAHNQQFGEDFSYDKNTNIQSIFRYDCVGQRKFTLSSMSMIFDGNRISAVTESSLDYGLQSISKLPSGTHERTYDENGRLITDEGRSISSITYRPYGNYPHVIRIKNGDLEDNINFGYRPDGTNTRTNSYTQYISSIRVNSKGDTTYVKSYRGNFRSYFGSFEHNGSTWLYHTPAGYITLKDGIHHYFARDYQGSTRAVYRENQGATPGYGGQQNSTTYALDAPSLTISTYTLDERMSYFASGLPYRRDYDSDAPTDRLHLGKPWLDLDGISLYNNSARLHDPITATFITQDPMAHQMPFASPYAMCLGNPIKFVDFDGQRPTEIEALCMAAHIYGDMSDNILRGGWEKTPDDLGLNLSSSFGLKSAIYVKKDEAGNALEYAYVIAGTETQWPNVVADVIADVTQPNGMSMAYYTSVSNVNKIMERYSSSEWTFIGHSMGAGSAALNAMVTNRNAITFNSAGVSGITRFVADIIHNSFKDAIKGAFQMLFNTGSNIDAYIMRTDILNSIQNLTRLPNADGNIHIVEPVDNQSKIDGHSVNSLLKSFGIDPEKYKLNK